MQKFIAVEKRTEKNGAIVWNSGNPWHVLAKVQNCPIENVSGNIRLTCYATNYADTYFSVPACTRYKGKYIKGYFTGSDDGMVFRVMDSHKHFFEGVNHASA